MTHDKPAPLSLGDLARLADWLAKSPRSPSEYSLPNLYLYRERHDYRLVGGATPFLLGTTYDGKRHALPLGPIDAVVAREMLRATDCLFPLDEAEVAELAGQGFRLDWCKDDSDYLYRAESLARLDGAKAKRAQAQAFERESAPIMMALEDVDAGTILDGWLADVGRSPEATDVRECREALQLRQRLGLEGWMVIADRGPVAFLLAGTLANDTRIVHFAKGRRAYAGAYPWMFARFAALCGVRWLNFEQDLGKPGFAQAKKALAPAARLRKYRVRNA